MTAETTRTKQEIIAHILSQEAYSKDSGVYCRTATKLETMPLSFLQDLDLLLTFRVIESNELDRKVQKILAN